MSYQGPERRAVITFTREDSDRLVRLEQQMINNGSKLDTVINTFTAEKVVFDATSKEHEHRLDKIEHTQSWMMGIGAAVAFIISCVVGFFKGGMHH